MAITIHGRAAVVLSNLNDTPALASSGYEVNSGQWLAEAFTTGSDSAAYDLDHISLLIGNGDNPSQPLAISIYTDSGGQPGAQVANGLLSGFNFPSNAGTYSYAPLPGSPVSLSASTNYWIVATSQASTAGYYTWSYTDSANATATGTWTIPGTNSLYSTDQGAGWTSTAGRDQFSITANPIPEPGTLALLCAGAWVLLFRRRHGGAALFMRASALPCTALVVCLSALRPAEAATVVYSDSTFANSDWILVQGSSLGVGAGTSTAEQQTSGGNPGDYREVSLTQNTSGTQIYALNILDTASYNPSAQGAITSISFSLDSKTFTSSDTHTDIQALGFVLLQSGNYYTKSGFTSGVPSWTAGSLTGLTASDFSQFGGGAGMPNFSATGGPIEFGFFDANSGTANLTTNVGVDNFSASLDTQSIPEPSILALMLAGAGPLLLAANRRRFLRRWCRAAGALALLAASAHGAVVLTNLSIPTGGKDDVWNGNWVAQTFQTGSDAASYALNTITLSMGDGYSFPSSPIVLDLYSDAGGAPGSPVASLTGSNMYPGALGTYDFSPAAAFTLSPSTTYWIVARSNQSIGYYEWVYASSTSYFKTDGWAINTAGATYASSSDHGLTWDVQSGEPNKFAIDTTPVPEPGTLTLLGIGAGIGLVALRRSPRLAP